MPPVTKPSGPLYEEVKWEQVTESKISTVMALLPASLQSGISPFRSIRRSMSLYNLRTKGWSEQSSPRPRPLSETDALVLTDGRLVSEVINNDHDRQTGVAQLQLTAPLGQDIYVDPAESDPPTRTASGIHWKFARQGASLISMAFGGSKSPTDEDDRVFERKVYIDGLAYLLNGLPQDLDASEAEQIRSSLPIRLRQDGQGVARLDAGSDKPRSILHRLVQAAVMNLICIFHFIMPYVVFIFKLSARMERKYKISEKLVGRGMDAATTLGKQGIILTESICKINDGKVGKALSEAVAWTVDGVTRGISDGVGEGVVSVRVRSAG